MILDIVKEYLGKFLDRKFYTSIEFCYTFQIETGDKIVLAGTLYA